MQLSWQKRDEIPHLYACLQTPIVRVTADDTAVSWPKFSNKPQEASRVLCAPDDGLNRVSGLELERTHARWGLLWFPRMQHVISLVVMPFQSPFLESQKNLSHECAP